MGDKHRSIDMMTNFLQSRIYVTECLYGLACVYYSMNEYNLARNYAEELVMQNPENPQVAFRRSAYKTCHDNIMPQAKDIHRAIVYKINQNSKATQDAVLCTVGVGLAALAAIAVARALKK